MSVLAAARPLPDALRLAHALFPHADYFSSSLSNLLTALTKAVVCLFCSCKSVAKALKRVLNSPCRLSMVSILAPAASDKLESALAVASDCLSEASDALAKLSSCASKARSKGVRLSILV